jgi:hypothetical protein
VRLTCWPIVRSVQCQLLALSRDASQAPRDVTAEALWQLSGISGARVSAVGIIEAAHEGDVEIHADYQSRTAHRMVRLVRSGPGQVLAILRGRAFAEADGSLRPVAGVHIDVISGPDAGKSATTDRVGGYELAGLVPGPTELRAAKAGYESTELAVSIEPGDGYANVLMRADPPQPQALGDRVGIGRFMAESPELPGSFTSRSPHRQTTTAGAGRHMS